MRLELSQNKRSIVKKKKSGLFLTFSSQIYALFYHYKDLHQRGRGGQGLLNLRKKTDVFLHEGIPIPWIHTCIWVTLEEEYIFHAPVYAWLWLGDESETLSFCFCLTCLVLLWRVSTETPKTTTMSETKTSDSDQNIKSNNNNDD